MREQPKPRTLCDNLNHRRDPISIRHCPTCGHIVNAQVGAQHCSEAQHVTARRQRTPFCVDCGTQLIFER
jgi:hypothetical protein